MGAAASGDIPGPDSRGENYKIPISLRKFPTS